MSNHTPSKNRTFQSSTMSSPNRNFNDDEGRNPKGVELAQVITKAKTVQYAKGQLVFYSSTHRTLEKGHILEVHSEDMLEPCYTIRLLKDGREKQTDDSRIVSLSESDLESDHACNNQPLPQNMHLFNGDCLVNTNNGKCIGKRNITDSDDTMYYDTHGSLHDSPTSKDKDLRGVVRWVVTPYSNWRKQLRDHRDQRHQKSVINGEVDAAVVTPKRVQRESLESQLQVSNEWNALSDATADIIGNNSKRKGRRESAIMVTPDDHEEHTISYKNPFNGKKRVRIESNVTSAGTEATRKTVTSITTNIDNFISEGRGLAGLTETHNVVPSDINDYWERMTKTFTKSKRRGKRMKMPLYHG